MPDYKDNTIKKLKMDRNHWRHMYDDCVLDYQAVLKELGEWKSNTCAELLKIKNKEIEQLSNKLSCSRFNNNSTIVKLEKRLKRSDELLKATVEIFEKQEASSYVLNLLTEVANYDGTTCDGECLLNDIRGLYEE